MSVTLSLFAGVGAQFLDNNGIPLSGGLIYTYNAGTTTPLTTYTTNLGNVAHSNPIVLNSSGRVPTGEIWLTNGLGYKFVVEDASNVLIGTYDNVPSSAQPPISYDAQYISYQEGYTVTAGAFIVGDTYLITFIGTTNFQAIGASANQIGTLFIATGVGSGTGTAKFSRTVQSKLQESISVKDFGATGDGVTDDLLAIQTAINSVSNPTPIYFPPGTYKVSNSIQINSNDIMLYSDPQQSALATIIFCSTNNPIIKFVNSIKARLIFQCLYFIGDKTGNIYGGSINTEPLVFVDTPCDYSNTVIFDRCSFVGGTDGFTANPHIIWFKFYDCSFGGQTGTSIIVPNISTLIIEKCSFQGLTNWINIGIEQSGMAEITGCYFENAGNGSISCLNPVITNNRFYTTTLSLTKSCTNATINGNQFLDYSEITYPPGYTHDIFMGGSNVSSKQKQNNRGNIPNLPLFSYGNPTANNNLEYFYAPSILNKSGGTSSSVVIDYQVDSSTVSSDTFSAYQHGDAPPDLVQYMSYGLMLNSGTTIGTTITGSNLYSFVPSYNNLINNGTFPSGSTAGWYTVGTPSISYDGTYLVITGSGTFTYFKTTHIPNVNFVYGIARTKSGHSNGLLNYVSGSSSGAFSSAIPNFFDNGDGTFDDLLLMYCFVTPHSAYAPQSFGFTENPTSLMDLAIRWVALIPGDPLTENFTFSNKFTYDPGSLAAGATSTYDIMADGSTNDLKLAEVGDFVQITAPYDTQGITVNGYVSATGQITVRLFNPTSGTIDLASGSWSWLLTKPLV